MKAVLDKLPKIVSICDNRLEWPQSFNMGAWSRKLGFIVNGVKVNARGNYVGVADSREEDYRKTAEALPENFYANLLPKLQRVLGKKNSVKDFTGTIESKLLGNLIRFAKAGDKLQIYFNGRLLQGVDSTHISAVDIAQLVANAEIKGDIKVTRPQGRSLNKDIVELEPIKLKHAGLKFPMSLQKKLRTDAETGKEVVATKKGQLNKKPFLYEIDYNHGIDNGILKESDYERNGNVYVKKDTFVDLGDLETSIYNTDEIVARSKNGNSYNDLMESGKAFTAELNGDLYLVRKNRTVEKLSDSNSLPKVINYDLKGYRGYNVVPFKLSIKQIKGKWVASYSHDGAEYALETVVGDTREEVVKELKKKIKEDKYDKEN